MTHESGEAVVTVSPIREWRGSHHTWVSSFRKYEFPVTVRKVEQGGRSEAADS
jgi:hypothetical protein